MVCGEGRGAGNRFCGAPRRDACVDHFHGLTGMGSRYDVLVTAQGGDGYPRTVPVPLLESVLTCPFVRSAATESMPEDACQYFYECPGCGSRLKPPSGRLLRLLLLRNGCLFAEASRRRRTPCRWSLLKRVSSASIPNSGAGPLVCARDPVFACSGVALWTEIGTYIACSVDCCVGRASASRGHRPRIDGSSARTRRIGPCHHGSSRTTEDRGT